MTRSRTARFAAAALLAPLALAAAPATTSSAAQATTDTITTAAQLPDETLALLPRTAAEAGLTYAPRLVSVTAPTRADRNAVVNSGLDATEHAGDDHIEVVLNRPEDETLLDSLGYDYEVVTPDLIAQEHARIMADAAYFRANAASPLPSGRTTYRVLADYGTEIDQLVADNPDLAKRISLGQSVEGRDLTGIEIGVGVNEPEDGRPVFLMFGNHHAREWPSAETPMEFAHELIADFNAGDARAVDLLTRTRAIIVPVSNPDGYDASRTSGDLIDLNEVEGGGIVSILATPGNAYKRKNCRIVDGQTQPAGGCIAFSSPGGYGIGIDLNRNYGALWGGPGADGFPNTASPLYRGPEPFSEPETQAIRTLISTRQVTTLISNHTFSNLLLRPVGVEPSTIGPDGLPVGFAPDECFTQEDGRDNGMQALGERMTAQTGYSNQFGWELYDTTGTTEDYSYNATGGYGYTFEIGPDQFHPPFEEVVAEYTGDAPAAQAVTSDNFADLTTAAGRDCDGETVTPDTVGGGLSEAYYIALENAADSSTHAILEGSAPAGSEVTVSRTGTFPLWDGTPFEDTVTTKMTVGDDGAFTYHVNPSTRPFVDSRPYTEGESVGPEITEVSSESQSGQTLPPAAGTTDIPVEVGEGIDAIVAELSADLPTDDYDMELLSPDLVVLGSSAGGDSNERIEFVRTGGVQPGTYVVRIINFAAAGPWNLTTTLGTVPADGGSPELLFSPRTVEEWTVSCASGGEVLDSRQVIVDRGESKDLGELCVGAAGAPATPAPAPDPDPSTNPVASPSLPTTGGGAALLGLLTVGAAVALRRNTTA